MPRQEKGTRIKGLPPKVRLQQTDAASGSYPTKFRTASDNRTGNYKVQFDASNIVDFNIATNVIYPILINSSSAAGKTFDRLASVESDFFSGSSSGRMIVSSGQLRKGISDKYVPKTNDNHGQLIQPFIASGRPEVAEMVSGSGKIRNPFYETGSLLTDVGPGFQQPLWSKHRIQIDISLGSDISFGHRSGSGQEHLMVYYDHATKSYNRVGSGVRLDEATTDIAKITEWYYQKAIGFGPVTSGTIFLDYEETKKSAASVIDSFGFPFHSRYYVPLTSSMLFPLSGVLSEPFLLEKVVVEFSATIQNIEYAPGQTTLAPAYGTFFILNQRGGMTKKLEYPETEVFPPQTIEKMQVLNDTVGFIAYKPGTNSLRAENSSDTHSSGSMDLVTALQFCTSSNVNPSIDAFFQRELMFGSSSQISNGYTTGFTVMSGTVKASRRINAFNGVVFPYSEFFLGNINALYCRNNYGGRTGLPTVSGRSWKSLIPGGRITRYDGVYALSPDAWENNPYLLLPTDKLIFGWQSPFLSYFVSNWLTNDAGKMTLHAGSYKLTLYGSQLTVGEQGVENPYVENHDDTLNQLLSSDSAYEIIG